MTAAKLGLDFGGEMCYTVSVETNWNRGVLLLNAVTSLAQYFIVGKAPFVSGHTSRHSSRQRRQANKGRFYFCPDESPQEMCKNLQLLLAKHRIAQPNYIIPAVWLDQKVREQEGMEYPFKLSKNNSYRMYGCYAWFQPENSKGELDMMYIGRATKVYNRIQQYWSGLGEPRFLDSWSDWAEENNEPFIPTVAVWVCEDYATFEVRLISTLNPRYNKMQRERPSNKLYLSNREIRVLNIAHQLNLL